VGIQDLSRRLTLRSDHETRPLWVAADGVILLEAFSPIYQQAYEFLVAISEPVARPRYIHKYQLTSHSLYAAVSINIDTETIITVLQRLCKTDLPKEVVDFIREKTSTFGKAKLLLKDNNYYVESAYPDVLRRLLQIPKIAAARVASGQVTSDVTKDGFLVSAAPEELKQNLEFVSEGLGARGIEDDDDDDEEDDQIELAVGGQEGVSVKKLKNVSFMIARNQVQEVKKYALDARYPLMEEYDFKNDLKNGPLPIDLRPSTKFRAYQEKALAKMFGNGRARSGIIVLPCGAGKSLTGVTACFTIKKSTMVITNINASTRQWR
jgi:DNA excision repair protein ERCC-3